MTKPFLLIRIEAAILAIMMALVLWHYAANPWLVIGALIAPDLSMIAYKWNARIAAVVYNLAHWGVLPGGLVLLAALGGPTDNKIVMTLAATWLLHISADRALGFGLKFPTGFGETHLGRIGKPE